MRGAAIQTNRYPFPWCPEHLLLGHLGAKMWGCVVQRRAYLGNKLVDCPTGRLSKGEQNYLCMLYDEDETSQLWVSE